MAAAAAKAVAARGGNWTSNTLFDMMAQGKPAINRANLDARGQAMFDRFAGNMGITNGTMTREQFTSSMSAMGGGGGGRGGRGGRNGGGFGGGAPGGGWGGGGAGGASVADPMAGVAEMQFRRMDLNGDGVLNYDEMSEALKLEKDKWDTNRDGFIDLAEFKAYLQARVQQVIGEGGEGSGAIEAEVERAD